MTRPPLVLGLTLCEDVTVDATTGNVSVLRAFTGLSLPSFPGLPSPFCAFAALTAGEGDARFVLEVVRVTEDLGLETVFRLSGMLRFLDPLQTVYCVVRLTRCSFPSPGEYLFTLWVDGEWMAHRRLRGCD